ncbi:hypothetical protein VST05_01940, partial [Lactobacillus delbrueckii subsp. lactis]
MAGTTASTVVAWVVNQEAAILITSNNLSMMLITEVSFVARESIVENRVSTLNDRLNLCHAATSNVGKAAVKLLHIAN